MLKCSGREDILFPSPRNPDLLLIQEPELKEKLGANCYFSETLDQLKTEQVLRFWYSDLKQHLKAYILTRFLDFLFIFGDHMLMG